jgi:phage gp46-like protein
LETRWLHTLPREKGVDRFTMDAEDAADTNGIEPAVMDQPPDSLGVHAELIRYLANADESGVSTCRGQDRCQALQVLR